MFEIIKKEQIVELSQKAAAAQRKRTNYNLHQLSDNVQRMLNALDPASYVRPHRHLNPPKIEAFVWLAGRLVVLFFDDQGKVTDQVYLDAQTPLVDIKPGAWHSIIALTPGSVVFETKDGPYLPATDKDFARWAPLEDTPAAVEYLNSLKKQLK